MQDEVGGHKLGSRVKRFLPILIGLVHPAGSFLVIVLSLLTDPGVIFSSGYAWVFVLIPGLAVPAGIILHRIIMKNTAWWAVAIGCVISGATTFAHLAFVAASSAVV